MGRGTKGPAPRDAQQRQHIAVEAARIMAEDGVRDFAQAKRKAAARLGLSETRNLPANHEVEQALLQYQRIFRARTQPHHLRQLRRIALDAMRMLEPFQPRLVSQVLSGAADAHSPVSLHLFADTAEQVDLFLHERAIPFETGERPVRYGAERSERYPLYRFQAGDAEVELTVFPVNGLRQAPLSPVDGRPMRRADTATVERLLEEESTPPSVE